MKRIRSALARFAIDVIGLSLAFFMAFLLRLDFNFDSEWFMRMIAHLPFVLVYEFVALYLFRATRAAWRFVSLPDVKRIILALIVAHIPLLIVRLILGELAVDDESLRFWILPLGVIFMNLALSAIVFVGVRVLRRMVFETAVRRTHHGALPVASDKTILIGNGTSCKQIVDSINLHPELGIDVVGMISLYPDDTGRAVAGMPVLGAVAQISDIIAKYEIEQAIIAQTTSGENIRKVFDACSKASIKTRIVPRMNAFISGKIDIAKMREVSVEDLLHRDPVTLNKEEISKFLKGRRILVSGAGGSIGSEICRQVLAFEPTELVLLEKCELFLYEIEREFRAKAPNIKIVPRLADICDRSRVEKIFEECRPEVIFHAAAYKHVPMLEYNPGEAIRNNVEGTAVIADTAVKYDADAFVMISTDKAVNPTSVMGTSKRIAELYIQAMSSLGKTRFCAVRFGNVLGSTGSVLPLFRKQISAGGPLTVTHADMVRYFMTIPEASQLVMQAATMASSGEIFVLDMGKPVKIVDLARDLIRLSGKTEKDIPIVFTGTRPGEKLFEELGFNEEHMDHTRHPKIYVGKLHPVDLDEIRAAIAKLAPFRDCQDNARVREAMHEIVPEMQEPAR